MELRKRAGLNQKQLAERLGLKSDQTVSDWEQKKRIPRLTPQQTLDMCDALQCDLQTLAKAFAAKKAA